MNRKTALISACVAAAGLAGLVGSFAVAQTQDHNKANPGAPEMKLPPGWTEEDMKACMDAGTPGKMHEHLKSFVGNWDGVTRMWMGPGGEEMKSTCTMTVTEMMDGRYTKSEMKGEMPGMGAFTGMGITGFDNVSQKFVSDWIDNQNTGIMNGVGELSADGKTMTWVYGYNCPIKKVPTKMRQIETMTGLKAMTMEAFVIDPKSGKEYKCMSIAFTKKS